MSNGQLAHGRRRGLPWLSRNSKRREDNVDSKVVTLIAECHLDVAYATALVQSGGRCEYCGCNLLHDRLGYEIGVVDCLLPKEMYLDDVAGCKDNWVLSCQMCSSIKADWNPDDGGRISTREDLHTHRCNLIDVTRCYIYERRAQEYDPVWFRVMAIVDR